MSTVTFQMDDQKAGRLAAYARARGITVEELLRQIVEDFLSRQQDFEVSAEYVVNKNAELYRRLAQ